MRAVEAFTTQRLPVRRTFWSTVIESGSSAPNHTQLTDRVPGLAIATETASY
ncbi:hypothetical protein FA13DRAFT_1730891 [Coprinellus micaceus]|uniref:Uncharacterized protein n=1 Tax=Coprinellus micaceus TaxID=71717 RepID=A0A4Y7THV0_COPMI|nr:hypothetical protein FA13DRAFT_1730891 [Coprinellus micaceus]